MKGRWRMGAERWAAEWLEVPRDTLENVARISIVGNTQVIIENYGRIRSLTESRILVEAGDGEVAIRGEHLRVRTIVPGELVADGEITGVDLR